MIPRLVILWLISTLYIS